MRDQYRLVMVTLVLGLAFISVACSAAVIYTGVQLRSASERIVQIQVANRDVMQDMTNGEAGLLAFGVSGKSSDLRTYELAMNWLPQDQRQLRLLAEQDRELVEAAADQERAIDRWLTEYAEPRIARGGGEGFEDGDTELFRLGDELFQDVRFANHEVDLRIEEVVDDIRGWTRQVLVATLLAVLLLPLAALGAVVAVVRRAGETVVRPLSDIAEVLDRLRTGDTSARAEGAGPQEIRQIAEALNRLTDENVRASEVEADVLSQLETIDRVRTDLVSTVSHELRTPLTSIKGYLELLQDDLLDELEPRQTMMVGAIWRNLDRLNELITNLLALSRAEETQLSVEPLDVRAVAAEVAADIRLTAAAREITVRTLQSVSPVVVMGDRSQLIRAVQNLVTNAVKFSPTGGAVEIRVVQDGDLAVVEVVDEGIGIPTADLPGLGSRFYRASNAMRAEIAGTGLGLRIVQTILDRHDGSLAVDSVEGQGSTFTIRLPVLRRPLERPRPAGLREPSYD